MAGKNYIAGVKLLAVLAELEDVLKHNYEKGDINQRTLANIAGLQADLFSSYVILLNENENGPLISRSIILRAILENEGAILHIKGNVDGATRYLSHVEKMQQQVKNHIKGIKTPEGDLAWSSSKIAQRIGLIHETAPRLYDTLSNFAHGNNVQYFFGTKEITTAYIKAIDSYWVSMFIDFMAELGVGLDMDGAKRKLIFDTIKEVGGSKSYDRENH